jgi:hypothetical protein
MKIGGSQSNSKSTNTVDPWSKQQYQNIAGQVQNTLNGNYGGSYQAYGQPMTAGLTPLQTQAMQMAQGNTSAGYGLLGQASQGAAQGAGFNPSQVSPQTLASTNLNPYLNPYQQNVIDTTMNQLDLQRQRDLNNQGSQFTANGAFGGARQGVSDSLTNEAYGNIAANTLAGLNSQNFSQAQQAAQGDITNNLQGQLANQSAGLQGANLNLGAAGLLGNLASEQQQLGINNAGLLAGLGSQEQQTNQNYLTNLYNEYLRGQISPEQQAQLQLGLLGETPMTTDTKSSGSSVGAQGGVSFDVGPFKFGG